MPALAVGGSERGAALGSIGVGREPTMNPCRNPGAKSGAVMSRTRHDELAPWVLADATSDSTPAVIAEGARPRQHSRLGRTRICANRAVEAQIVQTVTACARTSEPQARTIWMPNGVQLRCVTTPVLGPDNVVHAVQAWAGARTLEPPPRPTVAPLTWDPFTGDARTTGALEQLLDSTYSGSGVRTMPDLMRHLDRFDDRLGLLALFGDRADARMWSGVAVTAGAATGTRRHIRIVARRCGQGRSSIIRAVAHDISASGPAVAPTLPEMLLRHIPVADHHAIAVVDLRTGLVHEWIVPGEGILARWVGERPHLHPDDKHVIFDTRRQLQDGKHRCHNEFRIRFSGSKWLCVCASWTAFSVGPWPQVLLDVTSTAPVPTSVGFGSSADSSIGQEGRR